MATRNEGRDKWGATNGVGSVFAKRPRVITVPSNRKATRGRNGERVPRRAAGHCGHSRENVVLHSTWDEPHVFGRRPSGCTQYRRWDLNPHPLARTGF